MRSLWLIGLVPACFSPSPPTGVPCTSDIECPSQQRCDPASATCQLEISPPADGGPDDAVDGPLDGPSINCWPAWQSGTPELSAPVLAGVINTTSREQDPTFTSDALGLYFVREDVLMFATRPSRDAMFSGATTIQELESGAGETRLTEARGGRLAVFESRRTGGEGGPDFWVAERASTAAPWGTASQIGLAAINDPGEQFDPELTADGLRLYLSNENVITIQQIQMASRTSVDAAFGAPVAVAINLGPLDSLGDPALSPDELVMLFAIRSGGQGPNDLHFATRTSTSQPFTDRGLLVALDSPASNGDADVSDDGCTVIFGSDRAGVGSRDLYISEVQVR